MADSWILSGNAFHLLITLIEKEWLLMSCLATFNSRLNTDDASLVFIVDTLFLRVNHVSSCTLSWPCSIFHTWIMSPLFLLSSKLRSPRNESFCSYVPLGRPDYFVLREIMISTYCYCHGMFYIHTYIFTRNTSKRTVTSFLEIY